MFNLVDMKRLREGLVVAAKVIGCIGAVITTICGIVNCFNSGKSPPRIENNQSYQSSWNQYDGTIQRENLNQRDIGAPTNNGNVILNGLSNVIERIKENQRRKDPTYMPYIPYGPTQYECKNGDAFVLPQPILTHTQKMNHINECMINPYYAYNNPYAINNNNNNGYYQNPYYCYNEKYLGGYNNMMNNTFMGYENYPIYNNNSSSVYDVNYGNPTSYARYNYMIENNYNNITLEQQIRYAISQIPEPPKPNILSNDINASFNNKDNYGRFILPKFFNQYDPIQVNYIKYMNQVNNRINEILMNHGNIPLNNNLYAKGNVPDVNGWMLCENEGGIPKRKLKNVNTGECYPIPNDFIIPSELSLTMVAQLYGEQFKRELPSVNSYDTSFWSTNKNYEEMLNRTPQIYKDSCVDMGPQFKDCKFGDSLKTGYFGALPEKDSTIYRIQQEYTRGPELETSGLYDERLFAKERAEMYRNYNNTHSDIVNMVNKYNEWERNYITESPYQSLFLPSNSMIPDYRKQNPFENNNNPMWAQPNFRFDDLYYNNVNPICRAMYENHWRTNGINAPSNNWFDSPYDVMSNNWTNLRFDNNNNPYYGNAQIFGGPTDTAYQQMCQQIQQNPYSLNNMNVSNNPYSTLNFVSPELRNLNPCVSAPYEMIQGLYANKNNSKFFYSDSEMEAFNNGNFNPQPNNGYMNLGNMVNNKRFIETNERWQNGRFVINASTGVKYWVSDLMGSGINDFSNIDELVASMPNHFKRVESILGGGDYATFNPNLNNVNPFIRNTMANPNGVSWTSTQNPLNAFVGGKIVIDPNTNEPFQLANGVTLENIPTASCGNYELIAGLHANLMRKVDKFNDPIVTKEMLNDAYDVTSNMKNNNNITCGNSFKEVEDFFGNQIKVNNDKPEIKHESKFDENGREIIKVDKFDNVYFRNYKGEEFVDYKGGEIESTPCAAPLLSAEELLRNAMHNTEVYGNAIKE